MVDHKTHLAAKTDEVVAKPDVMLRIKLGPQIYETLSNGLDYTSFTARLREIYPAWDDSNNWVSYAYPQQNADAEFRMLGVKSWEAMWWQIRRTGYDEIVFDVKQTRDLSAEARTPTAPPAYTK